MTKDEALKLAEEALELSHPRFGIGTAMYIKAFAAIKEALAQPEQEPVAWRAPNWGHSADEWVYRDFDDPVLIADGKPSPNNEPLYTTPPQRKPLTDEELLKLWDEDMSCDMPDTFKQFKHTARAIEAAHNIKGGKHDR